MIYLRFSTLFRCTFFYFGSLCFGLVGCVFQEVTQSQDETQSLIQPEIYRSPSQDLFLPDMWSVEQDLDIDQNLDRQKMTPTITTVLAQC